MSKLPLLPMVAVMLLLLSGCGDSQPENVKVSAGHGIFLSHCVSCHGGVGSPPAPDSFILRSARLASEEQFAAFLRAPATPMMPPFDEAKLPDADLHELYVYLKTQAGQPD